MAGHIILIKRTTQYRGGRTIRFHCADCELYGSVWTRPGDTAEALVADIIAIHWGATGGDG